MYRFLIYCGLISLFMSCGNKRVIKKVQENESIKITYYIFSYISNVSDDFLEVKNIKTGETINLVDNFDHKIIDFRIQNDSIVVEHKPLTTKNKL